jgi:hypothetical protein
VLLLTGTTTASIFKALEVSKPKISPRNQLPFSSETRERSPSPSVEKARSRLCSFDQAIALAVSSSETASVSIGTNLSLRSNAITSAPSFSKIR